MNEKTRKLAEYLGRAGRIMIFTGAGISTSSGIPDFRGPQGVWKRKQPVYYQDFMRSEQSRVEHWADKLEGWPAMSAARPNSVHHAVVQLEKAEKVGMVVTQNIDGLHSLAGTSRDRLIELHGTNLSVECQTCHWRDDPELHLENFRASGRAPQCECGGFLKMATISFGQGLESESLERAGRAADEADLVVALAVRG